MAETKMARTVLFLTVLGLGSIIEGVFCWGWSYRNDNGPKFWSKEVSDCSGDKQHQSPIDIPKPGKRKYDSSMKELLFINYDLGIKGDVKNTGTNVIFNITEIAKKGYLQNGRLEIGAKYVPQEFHFHFGTKDESESGHTLEGTKYPMEMHIIHYKDEYGSLKKAVDYHDGVVIIVFFFEKVDDTNNAFDPVINFISYAKYKDDKMEFDGFSLRDITNANLKIKEDKGSHLHYFQYEGALDEPPCYNVQWLIFKDSIKLSSFQLGLFRQLKRVKNRNIADDKYDDYDKVAPNFRPLQDLGDRTVYESHNYSSSSDKITSSLPLTLAVATLLVLI